MSLLPKDSHGCPYLLLAPMEGLGDRSFRKSMAKVGGFDEAVTEFISVPHLAHVESLAKVYHSEELSPVPLASQIMGSDPQLMGDMAKQLEQRGSPRIDINCGCPSRTVTGRGAGSSLLKNSSYIYEVASAVVKSVSVPVTIKMRSGYEDTSLFTENLKAAEESGVRFITLHPRTKQDGYTPPAKWELIALAKETVSVPIVGNGDILNVQDALAMLAQTNCDALMIGRGAVINPFIFQEIKAHFANRSYVSSWNQLRAYLESYLGHLPLGATEKSKVNKLKQLIRFICKSSPALAEQSQNLLTLQSKEAATFLDTTLETLEKYFAFLTKK